MEGLDVAKRVLNDKTITEDSEFDYKQALELAKSGFKMKATDKEFIFGVNGEDAFFKTPNGSTPVHLRTVESISQQSTFTIESYQ